MLIVVACGVVLNSAGVAVTFMLNSDRVDEIQAERLRNTRTACLERSAQNRQIVAFLKAVDARQESIDRAAEFFPTPDERECDEQARKRVNHD